METPEFFLGSKTGDHFVVDDLLDFPNDDVFISDDTLDTTTAESSTVTAIDSCNSSFSGGQPHIAGNVTCQNFVDAQFSDNLCVPLDDLAELEWLSNFVEDSFSSEDLQKMQLISGMKAHADKASEPHQFYHENNRNVPTFNPEMAVPGKARSKRSRATPCNWNSRLLALSPTRTNTLIMSSESDSDITSNSGKRAIKVTQKKKEASDNTVAISSNNDARKCLHCATDKTPQWRSGPMGPKTLCNACGVRYKSGRLVPEYRPAASPTFMLTKHSNSHRKVIELRRQKEVQRAQLQHQQFIHQNMIFDASNGDDYLIHQHIGPDYRQLI